MFSVMHRKGAQVQDKIYETAYDSGKKVRELVDNAKDNARDAMETTQKQIRNYPVRATVIAAGAGFVLGLLLRRR